MLDLKFVVESRDRIAEMLARRGQALDPAQEGLWALDAERRQGLQRVEALRHRQRLAGEDIARRSRAGEDTYAVKA